MITTSETAYHNQQTREIMAITTMTLVYYTVIIKTQTLHGLYNTGTRQVELDTPASIDANLLAENVSV